MFVYADNAATTQVSDAALSAMLPYFTKSYGNPSSTYPLGQEAAKALVLSREKIARLLRCKPGEITFTAGGSESDNQILRSAAYWGKAQGKTHLIASAIEHHAVLHTLEALQEEGFTVTLLSPDPTGRIALEAVAAALRPTTALVSIMAANNETGVLQPIEQIGLLCHTHNILFHTDAVQLIGHLPFSLEHAPIDFLSASAHKFHGPKGSGFLFCRQGVELTSLIYGGAQERGKRAGTENVPAIVGMATALEESYLQMGECKKKLEVARMLLEQELLTIPRTIVHGGTVPRLPGHLNIAFTGISAEALLPLLGMNGICASSGSACASGSPDPSHVLLAMGITPEEAKSSLRFSLGDDITEEQIHYIVTQVRSAVTRLRALHRQQHAPEKGTL